ncbi:bifunctional glutamate N-acetyltransferase/amino-acid acetyltransferase ArgJ [Aureimonas phyllosphaerae]|uniref:Arginine biosynthesis bifunctional protein ArgJ n=1 Tax=Aureimonas phyllosphaerae TaxID=1166078 RepID=A0A7W6BQ16_9HYPH|nr:bifunctional glutamate N-acetyltransferase/amino-acid acetyltransferase ArgJ [Aureimonas phyllosphaerae]MBB3935976.1 glutamate N-acetyltransferase/amino-acid N-acetyltransferase [Aureimonas phyllosphaerae]MBB3960299.1 glutamate N-acetyltransferase/amino-acid N-acetyltransferase [Aureimonas phyllosphaerae]SFF36139.1 glutamate N-acetyltransferase [Aureimonas phyllosphaerae]
MSHPVSPLAPRSVPDMPAVAGVSIATGAAGIKYKGRTDVLTMTFAEGTAVAGVLTTSRCPSAPVDHCRASLKGGRARALVVNSGNANAFTGRKGAATTDATARAAAEAVGCSPSEVFLASTGVIGEPLDAAKITPLLAGLFSQGEGARWREAADAIMTTDTYAKVATREVALGGATVRLNGIAKGAGMIAPDMATMLSFLATDAAIAPGVLQALLADAVGPTFNSVTVDSDTSTSDTLLLFATGAAGNAEVADAGDTRLGPFREALAAVLLDLARQVARDGEGARKEIIVTVEGAVDDRSAKRIALSIANSPLVKTAVAGEDANWGRVVMAVGKAGEPAERDRLAISFGDVRVAVDGERDPAYSEAEASAAMKRDEIRIGVQLGLGSGRWTVYTCDLTKEYVAINGDYRS